MIRQLQSRDLLEVSDLLSSVICKNFENEQIKGNYTKALKDEIDFQIDQFKRSLVESSDKFFILKPSVKIIGTVGFGPPNKLICNHLAQLNNVQEVKSLYIDNEQQGRGLGKFLFNFIVNHMQNTGLNELCLDCGYSKSQPFWEKQMGKATITLENYWSEGSHHMIWKRKMTQLL